MKKENPLSESTEKLLRAPLPEAPPRPGFETRLLACLDGPPTRKSPRRGLMVAAAAALVLALLVIFRPAPEPAAPVVVESKPVLEVEELNNPLAKEADAVRSTAVRAGRFLISQFPSLPAEDQL